MSCVTWKDTMKFWFSVPINRTLFEKQNLHRYSSYNKDIRVCPDSRLLFLLLFSDSVMSNSLQLHGLKHARLPCPSPSPGACSNSCPLSQWCHPIISSSVIPFSSHLQPFPASGSFQMSRFFTSGGQSIRVTSVLPMNIQNWFPLGWNGWISLKSKGLLRIFSNTTLQIINSLVLSFLYRPTLTSIHDYWKNHSFD